MIAHDPKEIIAVVDDDDKIIGTATREEAHTKRLLHREVYVYIINDGKVLLQKRKDNGLWDHSVGGHFPAKETYLQGAIRETKEELGIKVAEKDLKFLGKERYEKIKPDSANLRFIKIYLIEKNFDFKPDGKEVERAEYFGKKEIEELLRSSEKVMTTSLQYFLKKYIMQMLR